MRAKMYGVALLVSGVVIDLSSILHLDYISLSSKTQLVFSLDDFKGALRRQGPDSLGIKMLLLLPSNNLLNSGNSFVSSATEGTHVLENGLNLPESFAELVFVGATLQLRGVTPASQPWVDSAGNILVYNGIEIGSDDNNDTEILMQYLGNCCSCHSQEHTTTCNFNGQGKGSVPDVLSMIKRTMGYPSVESSKTLWFGRIAFGRRSLLVHSPSVEDPRFLLSSVSPTSSTLQSSGFEVEMGLVASNFGKNFHVGYTVCQWILQN